MRLLCGRMSKSSHFSSKIILQEEDIEMPGGDGTGPFGQGPGTGRGLGRGGGRRRMGGRGPGGQCLCPNCGKRLPHQVGTPCNSINCPSCGARMVKA